MQGGKCQTTVTTLVYADVMTFRQKPHVSTADPIENRVEYAELKGYNDKVTITECHPAGIIILCF